MNIVFNKAASDNLHERSCNVLVVPREPFTPDRKRNFNLQRYKVLYICSNYSSILSRLDHRFHDLKIRCAFAVFQLMTILEEARHSLIIIEHDPPPPALRGRQRDGGVLGPGNSSRPPGMRPSCSTRSIWTPTCRR
jgi:hypothetical protein